MGCAKLGFTLFGVLDVTGKLTTSVIFSQTGFLDEKDPITIRKILGIFCVIIGCGLVGELFTSPFTYTMIIWCGLAFLVGVSSPFLAGTSHRLSEYVGGKRRATTIAMGISVLLFGLAWLISLFFQIPMHYNEKLEWWYFTGGLLASYYAFSATTFPGYIPISNFFMLSTVGQLVSATLFDHFGILVSKHVITRRRLIGVILAIIGVLFVKYETPKTNDQNNQHKPRNYKTFEDD